MLFRFLNLIYVCFAFILKCPEPAQWLTRARSHCSDPSKYFCLKDDLINGYSENCSVSDFLQPGRKNVLRGGLDADICSVKRYQPWPIIFYTNTTSNCIFLKTTCSEEGQVVNDNGNKNTDATCKCDYTKGYDFIVKPRNPCFCVPSEEDCSCFLKTCFSSTFQLTPDYECIHSSVNVSMTQCRHIVNGSDSMDTNQSKTQSSPRTDNISSPGLVFVFCGNELLDKYYRKANKDFRRCDYCENISVYNCYDCKKFLCMDCPKVHNKKNNYQHHALQSLSEGFRLNETSIVVGDSIVETVIKDILCLHSGEVVAAFYKKVVTFSVSGQQINDIKLEKCPLKMDVMDTNTVAVLLDNNSVAIVNFQQTRVKYIHDIAIKCTVGSFVYTENQFYVGDGLGITVIDMSGTEKRRIPLTFIPDCLYYDVDSQNIYCIRRETNKLICIDRDDNIEFIFDISNWTNLQSLTMDNKGNILVLCMNTYNTSDVIEVAISGKFKGTFVVELQHPMIDQDCFICFHRLTSLVVIGVDKTVSIYKWNQTCK